MANNRGKKYGGREKGTPNRLTKDLRGILKDLLYMELDSLEDRFDQLEPKQRIEFMIKLVPYAFSKLDSISHSTNEPLEWGLWV